MWSIVFVFASVALFCLSVICAVGFSIAANKQRTDEAYALLIASGGLGAICVTLAIIAGRLL